MPYDYSKVAGKIKELFGTQRDFAKAIGLSERSISLKLGGKVGWKQDEIRKACNLLQISAEDIPSYFFAIKVQC